MNGSVFAPKDFESEVRRLLLKPNIVLRCPDQWVGDVEWEAAGFKYLGTAKQEFVKRHNLDTVLSDVPANRLILVLESPHVDEYFCCSGSLELSAIGPANGKTGENIRKYLQVPTREFSSSGLPTLGDRFALILMNAIPYQCSLGRQLGGRNREERKTRDSVFRSCWRMAEQDFRARLIEYSTERTLVVNACTRGETKGGREGSWLRVLVNDAIISCEIPSARRMRRCHPSSLPNWIIGKSWDCYSKLRNGR
jgi:hypothetical protein